MIQAVFFDIGETLVDETHSWGSWADWLEIPRLTFFAVLGQVIERGEHHDKVFDILAPGLDIASEADRKRAAGKHGDYRDLITAHAGCRAAEIVYVGDRVDNDVVPAVRAGMKAVFVRRGPWGIAQASWPQVRSASAVRENLIDLPQWVDAL